jgi:hypothetical protein
MRRWYEAVGVFQERRTEGNFDRTKLQTQPVATGVFFLTRFFHNRLKNDAQDLKKNGLERRVPRFCTICDKNQPLNGKNEKVMAILVPRWA